MEKTTDIQLVFINKLKRLRIDGKTKDWDSVIADIQHLKDIGACKDWALEIHALIEVIKKKEQQMYED
ncbi:MAG: hypothetical protein ACTSUE_16765 [Promethearchaeota archaeon]